MRSLKGFNRRVFLYMGGITMAFIVVLWRLYMLQLSQSQRYRTRSEDNRLRQWVFPPLRGIIRDDNNKVLASGRRVFHLYIMKEKPNNMLVSLRKLQALITLTDDQIEEIVNLKKDDDNKKSYISVRKNLSWEEVSRIYVNKTHIQGIHIAPGERREYFYNELYAHIIGYVKKVPIKDNKNESEYPYLGSEIGESGLEKGYEYLLKGQQGWKIEEVDVHGRTVRVVEENTKLPTRGDSVALTINTKLQGYIAQILKIHKAASAVVMNIHTGEIKAMVSHPSFDPNLYVRGMSPKENQIMQGDPYGSQVNRTIAGLYAPASIFKVPVAMAALKAGVDPAFRVHCTGSIEMFDKQWYCWKKRGHGRVGIVKSLSESCDIWYYEVSQKVGVDNIAHMARKLGLGQKYDFGLPFGKGGVIPDKKWKKEKLREPWYKGDTVNTSIGQGEVKVSPLQLAVMTARIMNGGYAVVPRLTHISVYGEPYPTTFPSLNLNKNHIKIVQKGLYETVNSSLGTAHKLKGGWWKMGGKTGTGQVRDITAEEREQGVTENEDMEWKYRDNALFVGYAPAENPQFVVSVVVEHGGSGARIAAPIARQIFDYMALLDFLGKDTPKFVAKGAS